MPYLDGMQKIRFLPGVPDSSLPCACLRCARRMTWPGDGGEPSIGTSCRRRLHWPATTSVCASAGEPASVHLAESVHLVLGTQARTCHASLVAFESIL